MKRALTCSALATLMLLSQTGSTSACISKGGYTITSHRCGGSYPRSYGFYMTGRCPGPDFRRLLVSTGQYMRSGQAIINTYQQSFSWRGRWVGGSRGNVWPGTQYFGMVWADARRHAIVNNVRFY